MEYNQIFQPQTLEKLNQRSQDNLKKIMGNKSLIQTMISSGKLLQEIITIEAPYKEQLEQLAIQMVEDMYPIILEDNIKIDAKIVSVTNVNQSLDEIRVNNPNINFNTILTKDEDGKVIIDPDKISKILMRYGFSEEDIDSYTEDMDVYDLDAYKDITLRNLIEDIKMFLEYRDED
jgi:hypothetical protein